MNNIKDIYSRAVAHVLGIPTTKVTDHQRQEAKMMCFMAMYRLTMAKRTEEELFNEICEVLSLAWTNRDQE